MEGPSLVILREELSRFRGKTVIAVRGNTKQPKPKLVKAVRSYCENFYEWKKKFELRRHWQVYRRSQCPLCQTKLIRENMGKLHRRTFYCSKHQASGVRVPKFKVFSVLPIAPSNRREARLDH